MIFLLFRYLLLYLITRKIEYTDLKMSSPDFDCVKHNQLAISVGDLFFKITKERDEHLNQVDIVQCKLLQINIELKNYELKLSELKFGLTEIDLQPDQQIFLILKELKSDLEFNIKIKKAELKKAEIKLKKVKTELILKEAEYDVSIAELKPEQDQVNKTFTLYTLMYSLENKLKKKDFLPEDKAELESQISDLKMELYHFNKKKYQDQIESYKTYLELKKAELKPLLDKIEKELLEAEFELFQIQYKIDQKNECDELYSLSEETEDTEEKSTEFIKQFKELNDQIKESHKTNIQELNDQIKELQKIKHSVSLSLRRT